MCFRLLVIAGQKPNITQGKANTYPECILSQVRVFIPTATELKRSVQHGDVWGIQHMGHYPARGT